MSEKKQEWKVSGDCVEGCTSPPVCPAYWNSPLQSQLHGGRSQCEGVWTFNIKEGHYRNINLAGLCVAYGFNSPSPFPGQKEVPWRSIIYIDQQANPQQAEALERIYRTCWQVMGEVVRIKPAKIEFQKELVEGGPAARYSVKIDGVYEFSARPFRTADKRPRYVNDYFGGHVNIGVSEVNKFNDPDLPRSGWDAPNMSVTYYDFVLTPEKHHWLP